MKRTLFRNSLTVRITGVFVLLLAFVTAAGVIGIRGFIQRDLEQGTRDDLFRARTQIEGTFSRIRQEAALFAELGARAAQPAERGQDAGASTFEITLVEQSRGKGIRLDAISSDEAGEVLGGVLRRSFAGMPTEDYVLLGAGPARFHIVAAVPVGGRDVGRRVVTATLPIGREFLRRESRSVGGEVTLLSRTEVLSSSATCLPCIECIREVLFAPAQWFQLESGHPIFFTFDCKPEPQAVVAIPLRTFDGKTVVVALSRSRVEERNALFHATLGVVGGGIAFTLVMGGVFLLVASRVVRPLRDLTLAASGIAEGQYGRTVPVVGDDEVAELSTAFNGMSVSMEKAVREISDWNRLLETRVERKTRELEEVHLRMIEVERLAAMGQVAAGVAHELNNPMSGIMGYSELALEMYRTRNPETLTPQETAKVRAYFENIATLSERCRDIIFDMLRFARQPTEEFSLQSLNVLIDGTLAFLQNQLRQEKVAVALEYSKDLPPFQGNALQLQQVFTNLLMNAAQAMKGDGTITVRTRLSGGLLEAEFADTGAGIAPENLRRIFDPFFTTKPVGHGTGLGLSVSHSIVKRHGGEIAVSSVVGQGTTFVVRLPVANGPHPADDAGEKA